MLSPSPPFRRGLAHIAYGQLRRPAARPGTTSPVAFGCPERSRQRGDEAPPPSGTPPYPPEVAGCPASGTHPRKPLSLSVPAPQTPPLPTPASLSLSVPARQILPPPPPKTLNRHPAILRDHRFARNLVLSSRPVSQRLTVRKKLHRHQNNVWKHRENVERLVPTRTGGWYISRMKSAALILVLAVAMGTLGCQTKGTISGDWEAVGNTGLNSENSLEIAKPES